MIEAALSQFAERITQLQWDRDAARVRGNWLVADLYADEMWRVYQVVADAHNRLWDQVCVMRWDVSCRKGHW